MVIFLNQQDDSNKDKDTLNKDTNKLIKFKKITTYKIKKIKYENIPKVTISLIEEN